MNNHTNARIKILHIFGRMDRGGAEIRTVELMEKLTNRFEFHYCTLTGLPGELDGQIQELGGTIHPIPLGWYFPWHFRELIKQELYNVIHSHVHYFSGFILFLAAQANTPIRIAHFRSTYDGKGSTLRRRSQRFLMCTLLNRYATHILAVSQHAMASSWPNWESDNRCKVVYNGLDLTNYVGPETREDVRIEFNIPIDTYLVIHIGSMRTAKNHLRLISIFRELLKLEPSSCLLLVGRGGNRIEEDIRNLLLKLGITDRVIFAGTRSDIPLLLKAADILVFPSLWEGLPGAVLEASAAGIPTLASDIPSIREISEYLPLIHLLGLEESDRIWAASAQGLSGQTIHAFIEGTLTNQQMKSLYFFQKTPFTIENTAKTIQDLYLSTDFTND